MLWEHVCVCINKQILKCDTLIGVQIGQKEKENIKYEDFNRTQKHISFCFFSWCLILLSFVLEQNGYLINPPNRTKYDNTDCFPDYVFYIWSKTFFKFGGFLLIFTDCKYNFFLHLIACSHKNKSTNIRYAILRLWDLL